MKKSIIYIIPLLIAILFSACRKDEEVQIASLACENLSVLASYTTVSIEVDLCSNATIKEVVLEYTTDSAFSNHCNLRMGKFNKTERRYYASLDSLLDGTKYYYRFKAYNKVSSYTSAQGTFMTQKIVAPSMGGITVTNVSYTTAECVANVVSDGGDAVKERGVCYATTENPTISNSKVTSGNGTGSFTCNLSGLTANTTFYIRAYATNNKGTIYSEQATFKTNTYGSPTVTTSSVTNVTYTTATCGGNVTADGGQTVTARGVCYATIQNPTIFNSKVASGSGTGSFTCNLTGLTAGTTYYVRTYATNNKGTSYGTQVSFKTNSYGLPSVTTSVVTNISNSTATCGGNVTSDGGATVTERGVVYSTTQNPTTSSSTKVTSGSGVGSFTCNISNLQVGTTYYVRAYAKNSKGTSYGTQVSFKTTEGVLPMITTNSVTDITYNSAICGGIVITDGGLPIIEKGICYSLDSNPTINHGKVSAGSGSDNFICSISSLNKNSIYHVRAYAINTKGVAYGEDIVFKTLIQDGVINGLFSVSSNKKVYFSKGNLQKNPSTYGKKRFADNQYDIMGNSNTNITTSNTGWIDLLGWGTSENLDYVTRSIPYFDPSDNSMVVCDTYNWRILSQSEWTYLFENRANASQLYGKAIVCGVRCIIVLPDGWVSPAGIVFTPSNIDWATNTYSLNEWTLMEKNGAVCLPMGGIRHGSIYESSLGAQYGAYWSYTAGNGEGIAIWWETSKNNQSFTTMFPYEFGLSVRLVCDAN